MAMARTAANLSMGTPLSDTRGRSPRRGPPPGKRMPADPGSTFAGLMQTLQPDAIGMQEVDGPDLDRLKGLLGPDWRSPPPLGGYGSACIFWNSTTIGGFQTAEEAV